MRVGGPVGALISRRPAWWRPPRSVTLGVLVAVLVAGCGGDDGRVVERDAPRTEAQAPPCPDLTTTAGRGTFARDLAGHPKGVWVRGRFRPSERSAVTALPGFVVAPVRQATGGTVRVAFHDDAFNRLLASGSTEVFAQTADVGLDGLLASVRTIVGTSEGDDATFVGRCASEYDEALRAVAGDLGTSEVPVLEAVAGRRDPEVTAEFLALLGVDDLRGPDGRARLTLRQWDAIPPEERTLDETAPPEVMEGLQRFQTFIGIPEAWRALPAAICTRIDLGWNDTCTAVDASDENLVLIEGLVRPGGSVEFVVGRRSSLRDDPRRSVVTSLGFLRGTEIRMTPQVSAVVQSTATTLDAIARSGARLKPTTG